MLPRSSMALRIVGSALCAGLFVVCLYSVKAAWGEEPGALRMVKAGEEEMVPEELGTEEKLAPEGAAPEGPTAILSVSDRLSFTVDETKLTIENINVPAIIEADELLSIDIEVRGNAHGSWRLTVMADDDFRSGADTIPANSLLWKAKKPLQDGRVRKLVPQVVGQGRGNAMIRSSLQFLYEFNCCPNVGTYTGNLSFELSLE